MRHAAAAGVQHHDGGGAAGGVRAEEPQGVLPGLRVSPLMIYSAVDSVKMQRHRLTFSEYVICNM